MAEFLNQLKRAENQFILPVSKSPFSGWKDYDRVVLKSNLCFEDKLYYLRKRLELVVFNSLDRVYLRSAPCHNAVNGPEMSFFFIGTTTICCCIEALGGFVLNSDRENSKKSKAFLNQYMSAWSGLSRGGVPIPEWLWNNLRNGLAHALIISSGRMEDLEEDRVRDEPSGRLLIHAELLYDDLKKGVEAYFQDLTSQSDTSLCTNFERHFRKNYQTF